MHALQQEAELHLILTLGVRAEEIHPALLDYLPEIILQRLRMQMDVRRQQRSALRSQQRLQFRLQQTQPPAEIIMEALQQQCREEILLTLIRGATVRQQQTQQVLLPELIH